jgi:GTPase
VKTTKTTLKILFVFLADSRNDPQTLENDMTELYYLVSALGNAVIIDLIVQKGSPFENTYIGPGKAQEVGQYLTINDIDVILVNGNLSPNQKFNLTKLYWGINPKIQVWDRIDLILAIFINHAFTKEAKLQIDLARMEHMGPRIFGMGMILSRQGGGIGTRGIGETNTELMKRHWRRETKRVKDELDKLVNNRKKQIEHRRSIGLKTISLVGYTNAGKTTLFNILTHKHNLVENALFATLDSTVGEIFLPSVGKRIIISDTIGFIKNLPPKLIDTFKSTLLESINADLILLVVDVSEPEFAEKINVVMDILDNLKIPQSKICLIFNKIDQMKFLDKQKIINHYQPNDCVFISTVTKAGISELINNIFPKLL